MAAWNPGGETPAKGEVTTQATEFDLVDTLQVHKYA